MNKERLAVILYNFLIEAVDGKGCPSRPWDRQEMIKYAERRASTLIGEINENHK